MNNVSKMWTEITHGQRKIFSDSRKNFAAGDVFVALVGENHDATIYIKDLVAKGLTNAIVNDSPVNRDLLSQFKDIIVEYVTDTTKALQSLASQKVQYWREQNSNRVVIALTGSNGKTTTKEMLAWLLAGHERRSHVTKGNLNNHLGVPFTILEMPMDCEVLVLEMGTNHPGEIELLCDIAKPQAGLITNIGQSHLEFFHNEDNVMVEKSSLYRQIAKHPKGLFVINMDDVRLATLLNSPKTLAVGENKKSEIVLNLADNKIKLSSADLSLEVVASNIPEHHNRHNMALALALCVKLWPTSEFHQHLIKRVQSYQAPRNNRSMLLRKGALSVYLDAYNANPSSMMASLKGFIDWTKENTKQSIEQVWFILGDMNELGERAPEYHREIGKFLHEQGASRVSFIGRYADSYMAGFGGGEKFQDRHAFLTQYGKGPSTWNANNIFIKGSRTLQLEELVDITLFPVL